jgi:hypothetical protein
MSQITLAQRFYLGAVAALAAWVGIWCYFIPIMSESAIPWHVPPLCASFLGAMYLSGAVFNATCMCARRWADVRVIMPMIAIWTGGLLIISLFYLPTFNFARSQVWAWFGAYVVYPLIALWLMWTHRRQDRVHSVDARALPSWVRHYLLVQGSLMVALALALLCAPQTMLLLWPWGTGRMMLQLYAAPLLSYGVGSFILQRQHSWSEIRLALVAMGVFTGAEFAVSLRYLSFLNGPALAIALWFVWLGATTGVLGWLSTLAFIRTTGSKRAWHYAQLQRHTPVE